MIAMSKHIHPEEPTMLEFRGTMRPPSTLNPGGRESVLGVKPGIESIETVDI
jgi:hypothetical protein